MVRRIFALLVSLLVASNFVWVNPVSANTDYSLIRVSLSSMGTPTSIRVIINGEYSIKEDPSILLEQKEYRINLVNGGLVLTDGTVTHPLGTRFTFTRVEGAQHLRIQNNSYGWLNYLGNMEARVLDGGIRLVNYIHLETYLYGVVPSEMPNSWPLEALKAQAVAARTYAVQNRRPSLYYDLFDTDFSQVYKGYNSSLGNSIKAVNDTFGRVLMYGNSFAGAYYSSSNGGMTEAAGNIWPNSLPYSIVKEDPFDVGNPSNPNAAWTVTYQKHPVDSGLQTRLKSRMSTSLENNGYSGAAADIKILSIKDLSVTATNSSGRLSAGSITCVIEAKRKSDGEWITLDQKVNLDRGNTRSILNVKSLLLSVEETDTAYVLRGGGFGHGVGMSQYGAHRMAVLEHNYAQILDFYYPGTKLTALNIAVPGPDPSRGGDRTEPTPTPTPTPTPSPSPTPKPTPTPSPAVTGSVKVSSSLNVRQGPGTQHAIVGKLSNNTKVEVLEQSGSWYRIKTTSIQGYVSREFIVLDNSTQPPQQPPADNPPASPPPTDTAPPPSGDKTGIVTASSLNIRSGPSTKNHVVGMVVKGAKLTIHEKTGDWYRITYNAINGYVHGQYVQIQESGSSPGTNLGTATVTVSSLNVRTGPGTQFNRVGSLSQNQQVTLLEKSGSWYKIQRGSLVGFVDGRYLKLGTTTPPSNSTPSTNLGTAVVTVSSLNVRSGAGTQFTRVGSLSLNQQVTLLEKSGSWYKIQRGSMIGFVHGSYLKLSTTSGGGSAPVSQKGIVTAGSLNVRTGAGTQFRIITALARNTQVTILETSGQWYRIQSGSVTGFVHRDYIRIQ